MSSSLYLATTACILSYKEDHVQTSKEKEKEGRRKFLVMRGLVRITIVLAILFLPVVVMSARHIGRQSTRDGDHHPTLPTKKDVAKLKPKFYSEKRRTKRKGSDTLQIAGSSLPDCSHACGSCTPCRLVMVSFVCASLEEAETCPMAYKCMCNNKSYPVP